MLSDGFRTDRNSLNALRLAFATAVIVSHSWPLSGSGEDPSFGGMGLGHWAVAAFFVISGYLIAKSRTGDASLASYLWRRVLRIYPAFLAALLLVACVAAPIAAWKTSPHPRIIAGGIKYVVLNLFLFRGAHSVAGTPIYVPFPHEWNGSLWSLPLEFGCYCLIAVLGLSASLRRSRLPVCAAFVAAFAGNVVAHLDGIDAGTTTGRFTVFVTFFLSGSVMYVLSDRIPFNKWVAVAAAGTLIVVGFVNLSETLAGLPLAYLCLYAGQHLPLRGVGNKNDISYGMYVYAFPVQQVLATFQVYRHGIAIFAVTATAVTAALAACSWHLLERPAMSLGRRMSFGAKKPRASSSHRLPVCIDMGDDVNPDQLAGIRSTAGRTQGYKQ